MTADRRLTLLVSFDDEATAEARRRHPELPADLTPESEVVSQPWGDTVLTLTWHYDVPVPSAVDAA